MSVYNIDDILRILPHRYPMLLVDEIVSCDFEKHIVGIKNLTMNEPFFQGHFPENPVMPGVLQLEAIAQTAGILLNKIGNREGKIALFTGINNAKFRRILRPGDILRMEAELIRARMKIARVHGKIYVGEELATEADLTFSVKDD